MKNSDIFRISAKDINCGYPLEPPRRGGSDEFPQSIFLSRNKKNNVHHCKPEFYYIKVEFKGVKIIWVCFRVVRHDFFLNKNYDINEPAHEIKPTIRRVWRHKMTHKGWRVVKPQHNQKTCVISKDLDQPEHPSSMARVLVHPSVDSPEAVEGTCNRRRHQSDCADAQADLSLRWSHKCYYRFCRALAELFIFFFFISPWKHVVGNSLETPRTEKTDIVCLRNKYRTYLSDPLAKRILRVCKIKNW